MILIDAFALTTAIEKRIDEATNEDFADGLSEALIEVHFAPTIDAVPVVRCKDCKFNYANQIPSEDVCQLCVELPITGDFFCKRGERKDSDV